jgi:hypothetical protein
VTERADVVVIGGGVMGAAALRYLAELGCPRPLLLERDTLASGSTGHCAGGVRTLFSDELNVRIALESIRRLQRFEEEVGEQLDLRLDGYLFLLSDPADVELLGELAARRLPTGQALHGDAHLFNCLPTAAGPVWHDLETACRGPREYDLAALVLDDRSRGPDLAARAALAAYGSYDDDLLDEAVPVYAAWVAASFMLAVERRPDAAPALERQLVFLRRYRA